MYELVFRTLVNIIPITSAAPDFNQTTPVVVNPVEKNIAIKSRGVTLAESESRTNISMAELGVCGEQLVQSSLKELYPQASVTHTAKTACCADVRFIMGNTSIVVEVKTYSRTVPTTELDKFRRDIVATSSKYGIFISLNGVGITGVVDVISDEITANYKMVIIVANKDTLKFLLRTAVDTILRDDRRANIDKTTVDDVIKSNTAALYELQRLRQCFNKDRNDIDIKIQNINNALSRVAASMEATSATINIAEGEQVDMIPLPADVKTILGTHLPQRWKCMKKNRTSSEYEHCDNHNIKIIYNKDLVLCAIKSGISVIPQLLEMQVRFEYDNDYVIFPLTASTALLVRDQQS